MTFEGIFKHSKWDFDIIQTDLEIFETSKINLQLLSIFLNPDQSYHTLWVKVCMNKVAATVWFLISQAAFLEGSFARLAYEHRLCLLWGSALPVKTFSDYSSMGTITQTLLQNREVPASKAVLGINIYAVWGKTPINFHASRDFIPRM